MRVAQSSGRSVAWRRRGIAPRLLVSVLLFSSAITLVLTLLQLYLDYRHDLGLIETRFDEIERAYLGSLADSLWHLDEQQLTLQLQGLARLPDIRTVEVRETAATGISPLVLTMGTPEGGPVLVREYPLVYSSDGAEKPIGLLRVEATLAGVYRGLLNKLVVILVSQGAKTFLVSLFIIFIFHRLVTRHLATIAHFLSRYDLRQPQPPLALARRAPAEPDELDQTVAAFNTMCENLKRAYDELTRANAELERDIAERRHVEEVLRDSEAKIRRLFDANIVGIFLWELGGRVLEANDAFLSMLGYDREDIDRMNWEEMTPPEWADRGMQTRKELKATTIAPPYEKEFFRKDGSRVPVLIGAAGFGSDREGVAFVLDLTERKRAEAEARESERRFREVQMELAHANRAATMGHLTASIAHEVNQPITAARTNAMAALRFLGRNPPDLAEVTEALDCIVSDTGRANDIIGRIRALIQKAPPLKESVDLNEAIREVIELTRGEAVKAGVSVHTVLADDLPVVEGDRVQLQQVVLNLIVNAIQAMGAVADGVREVVISTARVEPNGVLVAIKDFGPGLAPDRLKLIFTPFYTTKPGGLGVGLSICRSIIEAHEGRLWITANQPRGTIFQFTLPAIRAAAS